jgi:hypothetical protein
VFRARWSGAREKVFFGFVLMVTAWAAAVVPKFPVFHHVTDTEKSTDMFSHPETIEGRKMIRR